MRPGATRRTEPIAGRLQSAETRNRGQKLWSSEGGSGGIRGPACSALCASRGWRVHQAKSREKSSAVRHGRGVEEKPGGRLPFQTGRPSPYSTRVGVRTTRRAIEAGEGLGSHAGMSASVMSCPGQYGGEQIPLPTRKA